MKDKRDIIAERIAAKVLYGNGQDKDVREEKLAEFLTDFDDCEACPSRIRVIACIESKMDETDDQDWDYWYDENSGIKARVINAVHEVAAAHVENK
jgi:hypothetical protein